MESVKTNKFARKFLRLVTKKSQIERICETYNGNNFPYVYDNITLNLRKSNCSFLRDLLKHNWPPDIDTLVETIIYYKCGSKKIETTQILIENFIFFQVLKKYFRVKYAQNEILYLIDKERAEIFDTNNENHRKLLNGIWKTFFPHPVPPIPSIKWTNLGFQRDDPSTDFRRYGVFVLKCFYFACNFSNSNNPFIDAKINPMLLAFEKVKISKNYFSFAIQFIKIMDITKEFIENDVFVEAFHRRNFTSPPKIENFNSLVKKVFILYCNVWDDISSYLMSDKDITIKLKEIVQYQLRFDPDFF